MQLTRRAHYSSSRVTNTGQMEPIDTAFEALPHPLSEPSVYCETLRSEADVRMKVIDRIILKILDCFGFPET